MENLPYLRAPQAFQRSWLHLRPGYDVQKETTIPLQKPACCWEVEQPARLKNPENSARLVPECKEITATGELFHGTLKARHTLRDCRLSIRCPA